MARNYDPSKEADQQSDVKYGPVPEGSLVIVQASLNRPFVPDSQEPLLAVGYKDLIYLPLKLEVLYGEYKGCYWFQTVCLGRGAQDIQLDEETQRICDIGGAQIKAMLEVGGKKFNGNWHVFDGLRFPVKVKISNYQSKKAKEKGYWNNEIARVLLPNTDDYKAVVNSPTKDVINPNGAVVGKPKETSNASNSYDAPAPSESADYSDQVPF